MAFRPVSGLVARHTCHHGTQHRTFLGALFKPFQSSNPVLESIEAVYSKNGSARSDDARNDDIKQPVPYNLSKWKDMQVRHAVDESKSLNSRLHTEMEQLKLQLSAYDGLAALLDRLDHIYAPSKALQYAVTILSIARDKKFSPIIDQLPSYELEKDLIDAIESTLKNADTDTAASRAAKHLIACYEDTNLADPDKEEALVRYQAALNQISFELQSPLASSPPKAVMRNMYQFLGLKTEIAKLHGFETVVEQVFSRRATSIKQVKDLHDSVRDRILPLVYDPTKATTDAALNELLGMSAPPSGANLGPGRPLNPKQQDERDMIRLEKHITLDGVITFCTRLCSDLFGVDVIEQTSDLKGALHWDDSVRLFHVHDSNTQRCIGSFYLDPFERPGKLRRPVTTLVLPRGPATPPAVYMSLFMQPPTWDTDPAAMTWEDIEAFLHELGHVMDLLLSSNRFGSIAGPVETLPIDRSELLPKFMELWMLERSTIYALMETSQSRVAFSDDSIDAAFRARSRRKHLELAQLAFYGSLEIKVFSDFDIRGEESLLSLQHRWAKEYTPHDMPPEKSMGPLVELFRENAGGRSVAHYRYLWCEAQSTALFEQVKNQHGTVSALELQQQVRQELLTEGDGEWRSTDALFDKYDL
ncbi:hypothetical protein MPSEU_000026100 [Mayamaea pseudoterrestris]|nr:hypothetical protein MPSEU_000026100 [Mayamaea pseudoterrestris]